MTRNENEMTFSFALPKKPNFNLKWELKIEEVNGCLIFEFEMVLDLKFNNETIEIDDN